LEAHRAELAARLSLLGDAARQVPGLQARAQASQRNGWFGGFLAGHGIRDRRCSGQYLLGTLVSIVVAAISFVVGLIFLPETKDRDITHM